MSLVRLFLIALLILDLVVAGPVFMWAYGYRSDNGLSIGDRAILHLGLSLLTAVVANFVRTTVSLVGGWRFWIVTFLEAVALNFLLRIVVSGILQVPAIPSKGVFTAVLVEGVFFLPGPIMGLKALWLDLKLLLDRLWYDYQARR